MWNVSFPRIRVEITREALEAAVAQGTRLRLSVACRGLQGQAYVDGDVERLRICFKAEPVTESLEFVASPDYASIDDFQILSDNLRETFASMPNGVDYKVVARVQAVSPFGQGLLISADGYELILDPRNLPAAARLAVARQTVSFFLRELILWL